MTATQFRDLLASEEFRHELQQISWYLASVKQQRPIVFALAKLLWEQYVPYRLEADYTDLVADGTKVEFKFTYDFDMGRLGDELAKADGRPLYEVCAVKATHGWVALPRLYADMVHKGADVFVWTIQCRDLTGVTDPTDLQAVCLGKDQKKWNKEFPYGDPHCLSVADRFLQQVAAERAFGVEKLAIPTGVHPTRRTFPSTYHFWICDLRTGGGG